VQIGLRPVQRCKSEVRAWSIEYRVSGECIEVGAAPRAALVVWMCSQPLTANRNHLSRVGSSIPARPRPTKDGQPYLIAEVGAPPRHDIGGSGRQRSPNGERNGRGVATPRPPRVGMRSGHDVVAPLPSATIRRPADAMSSRPYLPIRAQKSRAGCAARRTAWEVSSGIQLLDQRTSHGGGVELSAGKRFGAGPHRR
jgi:hypothetical protein